ncbi:hypothetical protein PCC7418_2803 [Halothece sp. PCC 7418]|uniref:methyltransferase domain-containing protein n=1 Tax=Halothece sp. (strain PCC 7418) TaxID=65093 RepID=UPI0002A08833|nr:methyltransferase domain-containing protein [Halothece sp. PCC 7418]AFZ44935.1 hypothetical protein PCC7418_2803 [Halothece sp. PCC 7418]
MDKIQYQNNQSNLNHPQEKQTVLENFNKVANQISPPSNLIIELGGSILRWTAVGLTRFLQDVGYNKRKLASYRDQSIMLNIGSGEYNKEQFLTTDILPAGEGFLKLLIGKHQIKNDLFLDVTYADKHLFDCADSIVLSHVLEHVSPKFALQSLRNCWQYLKPNGAIRVTVPYLGVYETSEWPKKKDLKNPMLGKNLMIYCSGHQFMYDAELLILLLQEAGFQKVQQVSYQEGLLGYMDTPGRQNESIYVTGIKPKTGV